MKVCVLDMQPISPAVGGGRLRLLGMFHALGMETTYVGTYDWPGEPLRDQWLTSTLREVTVPLSPEHFTAADELRQRACGKPVIDSAFHQMAHLSPAYLARAVEAARQADIVVFEHPWVYPAVADTLDLSRQLLVYDSQNMEGLLRINMLDDGAVGTEVACEVIRIERDLCRAAHLVLACSHEDRILFHDLYGVPYRSLKLCPNGVFTNALKPATSAERAQAKQKLNFVHATAAIFIGSGYQFNVEAAQFIIDELAPEFPSVLFVIGGGVGDALPERYHTREQSNVRITGMLSDEDKCLYFKACDVALNPMFGGSGTNIKMFDYMAAGLPVVSTAIGARGIIMLPSPAFLVAVPEQFAVSLRTLLGRPSFWRAVSRNARRLACDFYSWENISPSVGSLLAHRWAQLEGTPPEVSMIAITNQGASRIDALRQSPLANAHGAELIVIDQGPTPWANGQAASSSRFRYVHTNLQQNAALANLGAFLAQGEALLFSGDHAPAQESLDRVQTLLGSPEAAVLTASESLGNLDCQNLLVRQDFLNSTEGFLPGSRSQTVRIQASWERQSGGGRGVFVGAPLDASKPVNIADWVGCAPRDFVHRAAAKILGKFADPAELDSLIDRLESGACDKSGALQELLRLRVRSGLSFGELVPLMPEMFKDQSVFLFSLEELLKLDGEAFVKNIYRLLLRREPDSLGLSTNVCSLEEGATTREDIIRGLLGSEEALRVGVRVIGVDAYLPQRAEPGALILG
jgi:glycosyltransferase involved in cell wall biosynthesis